MSGDHEKRKLPLLFVREKVSACSYNIVEYASTRSMFKYLGATLQLEASHEVTKLHLGQVRTVDAPKHSIQ